MRTKKTKHDEPAKNKQKEIKRYKNRKLYDVDSSKYINLGHVLKWVRQGIDITIVDQRTNQDITLGVLHYLAYQGEKKSKSHSSVTLLNEILRHGDGSFTGYIAYLQKSKKK